MLYCKKRRCYEKRKELFIWYIKSDLYNTLAELAFKYHKADKPFTQEDFDQAYEWFSVHFFEDEFPIED